MTDNTIQSFHKKELWPKFESLFIDRYCPDFWSINDINLPYGRVMVMNPSDMPTMLWRANLTKIIDYNTILHDMAKIENAHNIPVGFSISSSWRGDIERFKKLLKENAFELKSRYRWLAKDISVVLDASLYSGFTIEKTKDLTTFADILGVGFSSDLGKIFLQGALKNTDDSTRGYFIAKNPQTKEIVGCAAAYYHGAFSYMNCLAVKPEDRRQGIARDLVNARIGFLKNHGVKYIVTAVNETNENSMQVQQKSGYVHCETTEYWMKSSA